MTENYPYTSVDYLSENFKPKELILTRELLKKSTKQNFRNEVMFIYVKNGQAQIEINAQIHDVIQGDFIQIMPYHVHRFILRPTEIIEIIRCTFSIGLLLLISNNKKNYIEAIKQIDNAMPIVQLKERAQKQLIVMCEEIYLDQQDFLDNQEELNISLVSFLCYLYHQHRLRLNKNDVKANLNWIVLQYIHIHHQEKLTAKNVAEKMGITVGQVTEAVKKITSFSFSETLKQIRIRNAAALTQFDDLSLNQIGKITGFSTDAYFYKSFKETYDMTPDQFKKEQTRNDKENLSIDIWEITIYLLEHCTEELTLTQISQQLGYSPKKINDLFKESFQQTYKEILNQLRVMIGRNLLLSLPLSIAEVANRVGFNDVASFSRNFKKVYQCTPSQFLKG